MGSSSSETSSCRSITPPPPSVRRSRTAMTTLSVSAVSPTRGTLSRTSSSESSLGSSPDTLTPRQHLHQRSKKRPVIQLTFPYVPATVPNANAYKITSEAEPLKSIPFCLIPNEPAGDEDDAITRPLPPILHLGWSIDQERLLEWSAREGFRRTITDINGHYVFDYTGTVAGALHYFAQRAGADVFQPYIQLTSHRREPIIIALASNYTVSEELDTRRLDIFALGSLLRREGLLLRDSVAARWYIDYKEWQWVTNKLR